MGRHLLQVWGRCRGGSHYQIRLGLRGREREAACRTPRIWHLLGEVSHLQLPLRSSPLYANRLREAQALAWGGVFPSPSAVQPGLLPRQGHFPLEEGTQLRDPVVLRTVQRWGWAGGPSLF